MRRQPRRKWFWVAGSLVQALSLLGMATVAWHTDGALAGGLLLGLLAVFSLARGVCSVASKDVLAKTVSKARRGSVSGHATTVGGVAVVLLGVLLLLAAPQIDTPGQSLQTGPNPGNKPDNAGNSSQVTR